MSEVTLASVLREALNGRLAQVRTSLPAKVLKYDAAARTVDVEFQIADIYSDESGDRIVDYPPICTDVPVMFPGSGGARITWTINPGDYAWIMFASSASDIFKIQGGRVDPEDTRHHHLSDAFAMPVGSLDYTTAANDTEHSGVNIEFTSTEIKAGGSSSLALKAALDALRTGISSASISVGAGGAATINAAADTAYGSAWNDGTDVLKGG